MYNKLIRAVGIGAGVALLGMGLSACGASSGKAGDDFSADKVAAELNAARPTAAQQSGQVSKVSQLRSQINNALGTDVYPQAVWAALEGGKLLPVNLASSAQAVKVAKQELSNQAGYTESDIRKWVEGQVKQGALLDGNFSVSTIDFLRLQKFSVDAQQGAVSPELLKRLESKFSAAYEQAGKQVQGMKTSKVLTQVLAGQTGIPVVEPDVTVGVNLQGIANAEQTLRNQVPQANQGGN